MTDRYALLLTATLALGLGAVAVVNGIVDPSGVYDLPVAAVAPHRVDLGTRTAKADQIADQPYDVVILGTSRAAVGLDPEDPVWGADRVYNLGLPQSNVVETVAAVDWVLEHQQPREVVWLLDLLAFGDGRRTSVDFARSRLDPSLDPVAYHADKLVGWSTLVSTAITLKRAAGGEPGDYTEAGHHHYHYLSGETPREASLRWLERYLVNPATYGAFTYDPERVTLLFDTVERLEARGVRVTLIESPVHATQLELIRAAGLWPAYERWLGELAILGQDRAVFVTDAYAGARAVPLPRGDAPFPGYWEPSHFTPELGAALIAGVRAQGPPDLSPRRLHPDTFDGHLRHLEADRLRWREANREDAHVVDALAACVASWRDRTGSPAQARIAGRAGTPGCRETLSE